MAHNAKPIHFGFLTEKIETTFSHGSIAPLPDFDFRLARLSELVSSDGYLYPPNESGGESDIAEGSKPPAHMFRIPASHKLVILPDAPEENPRDRSAGFILHLLALLFKTRLQFETWFVDGRVPVHVVGSDPRLKHPGVLQYELSLAYETWIGWDVSAQRRFGNILYLYSRSCTHRRDWELFIFQYIIMDSCWKMGKELFGFKADRHGKRLVELYKHFGIDAPKFMDAGQIVRLRNDLFHDAIWAEGRPGHAPTLRLGYCPGMRLAWLNEYIIRLFLKIG